MGRPGKKQDRLLAGDDILDDPNSLDVNGIAAFVRRGGSPEQSYSSVVPPAHRRKFAQFFTPPKIASLMAEWALGHNARSVIDPALGMGALVRAAIARNPNLEITAFEKDPVILRAYLATHPELQNIEVILGDFLALDVISAFDAAIMNPPYLRHHDLSYDFDIFDRFSQLYGIELSKLSNSYLLFTLKTVMALSPGGRASIIIPTEWMNANFGSAMKRFLIKGNFLKEIIYFSNCSQIFEDALTTACVLLIEKAS